VKAALALLLAAASAWAQAKAPPNPRAVYLAMRDGLRFDPPRFTARPGEWLELQIENGDTTHQPHNFLLLAPGTRTAVTEAALALATTAGAGQDFVPAHPAILFRSALLAPERQQTLVFRVPTEPGVYPYLCTVPGHSAVMYGALYAGVPMPPLAEDKDIPPLATQGVIPGGGKRPFVQRMFMPEAGPAAIAVALPGEQNFCWDAGACRLRYAWRGPFIDAGEHWRGKGAELARLPAEPWWRAADFPLRLGMADGAPPEVRFLGYRLGADGPEFHYRADGVEVFEQITPSGDGLAVRFRFAPPDAAVFVRGQAVTGGTFTLALP
jgi:azurin